MTYRVLLTPQAEDQLREGDAWWRENRRAAPELLIDEFERALVILSELPSLGSRFTPATIPGIRRLLLRRVGYWVYYLPDDTHSILYVLAVWSGHRGTQPDLPAP